MRCLLAVGLLCVGPLNSAVACGAERMLHLPAFHAQSLADGAIATAGGRLHQPASKAGLLRLRQLDDATTATIFCELSDGSELDVLEEDQTAATDEHVAHLKLDLLSSEKVDEMLDQAVKLPRLESITINFCWGGAGTLTKAQVEKLGQCKQLQTLRLTKTNIAAGNLQPLSASPRLEQLILDQKSDVPVQELRGLESLRLISSDQDFSPQQRTAMDANLPNCRWVDPSRHAPR